LCGVSRISTFFLKLLENLKSELVVI